MEINYVTSSKLINSYENGNTIVSIYEDGTKIRKTNDLTFISEFPESVDIKITNDCDLNCDWCHEQSYKNGDNASYNFILNYLKGLPNGVELALGGGNVFKYPYRLSLLKDLKDRGFICNMTINGNHISEKLGFIELLVKNKLIYGLGISYTGKIFNTITSNEVYHVIAGIHSYNKIKALSKEKSILILGYKDFGKGIKYKSDKIIDSINNLKDNLWRLLVKDTKISFDNLALSQLDVKNHLTKEQWHRIYMGDDGCHTMYVDAVKQEYAKSSISNRHSCSGNIKLDFKKW